MSPAAKPKRATGTRANETPAKAPRATSTGATARGARAAAKATAVRPAGAGRREAKAADPRPRDAKLKPQPAATRAARGSAGKPAAARAAAPAGAPKSAEETRRIMARLFEQHPNAFTELDFRTPFELLIATILSAQSTDRGVNLVTPGLFAKYPTPAALAAADVPELERMLKPTGFFRQKAKAVMSASAALVRDFGGEVPADMDKLTTLPGVGRKTANVVLGHALGVPGLPVDRHVLRVANRIGIAHAATPEEVETQLCAAMPRAQWTLTSDTLILHGRRICRPHPLCDQCFVVDSCDFARTWGRTAAKPDAR